MLSDVMSRLPVQVTFSLGKHEVRTFVFENTIWYPVLEIALCLERKDSGSILGKINDSDKRNIQSSNK